MYPDEDWDKKNQLASCLDAVAAMEGPWRRRNLHNHGGFLFHAIHAGVI
jgi:hypothetical protein